MPHLRRLLASFLSLLLVVVPLYLPLSVPKTPVQTVPEALALDGGGSLAIALKEYALDFFAWMAADIMLQVMNGQTIDWATYGFEAFDRGLDIVSNELPAEYNIDFGLTSGSYSFLVNPKLFFNAVRYNAAYLAVDDLQALAGDASLDNVFPLFSDDLIYIIQKQLVEEAGGIQVELQASLTPEEIEAFNQGFQYYAASTGGDPWGAFLEIASGNNNTLESTLKNALAIVRDKERSALDEKQTELELGGGFFSLRQCTENINDYDPYDRKFLTGQADGSGCLNYEDVTPGSIVGNEIKTAIAASKDRTGQVDEITEFIVTLISYLTDALINQGLSSLSQSLRTNADADCPQVVLDGGDAACAAYTDRFGADQQCPAAVFSGGAGACVAYIRQARIEQQAQRDQDVAEQEGNVDSGTADTGCARADFTDENGNFDGSGYANCLAESGRRAAGNDDAQQQAAASSDPATLRTGTDQGGFLQLRPSNIDFGGQGSVGSVVLQHLGDILNGTQCESVAGVDCATLRGTDVEITGISYSFNGDPQDAADSYVEVTGIAEGDTITAGDPRILRFELDRAALDENETFRMEITFETNQDNADGSNSVTAVVSGRWSEQNVAVQNPQNPGDPTDPGPDTNPPVPGEVQYKGVTTAQWEEIKGYAGVNTCRANVNSVPDLEASVPANQVCSSVTCIRPGRVVVLDSGRYTLPTNGTLTIGSGQAVIGKTGANVVIDARNVDVGVRLSGNGILANVKVLYARNYGVIMAGDDNTVYRVAVGYTGYSSFNNVAGFGIAVDSSDNCVVSADAYAGFNEDGAGCSACVNGGNADGITAKFDDPDNEKFVRDNVFVDVHSYYNSDDGWDLWQGGTAQIFFSSASSNGKAPPAPGDGITGRWNARDGNGFKFGASIGGDTGTRLCYKCTANNNLNNGFDRNGSTRPIQLVQPSATGNGGQNFSGVN